MAFEKYKFVLTSDPQKTTDSDGKECYVLQAKRISGTKRAFCFTGIRNFLYVYDRDLFDVCSSLKPGMIISVKAMYERDPIPGKRKLTWDDIYEVKSIKKLKDIFPAYLLEKCLAVEKHNLSGEEKHD